MKKITVSLIVLSLLLLAYLFFFTFAFSDIRSLPCGESNGNYAVECQFTNPEDIIRSGVSGRVLVSEFKDMWSTGENGALSSYEVVTGTIKRLYPVSVAETETVTLTELWGEPTCTTPPELFEPHGIDMIVRNDGRHMLGAVNHGKREAVELFEYLPVQNEVIWRGCVVSPKGYVFNDVAVTPDGGLFVTMPFFLLEDNLAMAVIKGKVFDRATGAVAHWSATTGLKPLDYTAGPFPNGIAYQHDSQHLFVNYNFGHKLTKFDLSNQSEVQAIEFSAPDNLNWSQDGHLLVAVHSDYITRINSCFMQPKPYCPVDSVIYRVDPNSMQAKPIFSANLDGFGFATSAVDTGQKLLVGSASGQRLAVAAYLPNDLPN